MIAHSRAMVAAAAYAFISGRKVAGIYDHSQERHLRIAAEAKGPLLQGFDGDRQAKFGGALPELYDVADETFISLEVDGVTARGYDRASSSHFSIEVKDRVVQLYDHGESAWFAFEVQLA